MKNGPTKDSKAKITEGDLQSAIRKFLDAGGMIRKLPDQKTSPSQVVGMRYNASEMGGELS